MLEEGEGKASSLLPWDVAKSNGVGTLCMGALGGLYRPTPKRYNGNPVGRRARLSVSPAPGFSADRKGPRPVWWLITVVVLLVTGAWTS